jgi:hypothetical protein
VPINSRRKAGDSGSSFRKRACGAFFEIQGGWFSAWDGGTALFSGGTPGAVKSDRGESMDGQKMLDLLLKVIGVKPTGAVAERFFSVSMIMLVCGVVRDVPVSVILESLSMVAAVSVVTILLQRLEVRWRGKSR